MSPNQDKYKKLQEMKFIKDIKNYDFQEKKQLIKTPEIPSCMWLCLKLTCKTCDTLHMFSKVFYMLCMLAYGNQWHCQSIHSEKKINTKIIKALVPVEEVWS